MPVERLDLVQKYTGATRPPVDRLGGTSWERAKGRVKIGLDARRNPRDGMVMTAQTLPQGYYAASAEAAPERLALIGTVTTDVCVIGGGYTGLSAALHLAKAGVKTVLLEAETIAFAASGRNGGQIHTGHRKDQSELETWLGKDHARANAMPMAPKNSRDVKSHLKFLGFEIRKNTRDASVNTPIARMMTRRPSGL